MSLLGMQTALARILTEEETRDRFFADPEGTLAGLDLSPRERASLTGIDKKRLAAHAHIVTELRFRRALRAFPLTREIIRGDLERLAGAYARRFGAAPIPEPALAVEAGRMATFLLDEQARKACWPWYLPNVVRYEERLLRVGGPAAPWTGAAPARKPPPDAREPLTLARAGELAARLRAGVELGSFECDVLVLARRISSYRVPERVLRKPLSLLVYFDAVSCRARVHRLREVERMVLERCDGRRSLAQVVTAVMAETDRDEAERAALVATVLRTLGVLRDAGAVEMSPLASPAPTTDRSCA